jgi:uncharacterized RDD family membrane protein YckC
MLVGTGAPWAFGLGDGPVGLCGAGDSGASVGVSADGEGRTMSTVTYTFQPQGSRFKTRVTGRRVAATVIDGLIFGVGYCLLALAFGDIRVEGEAANWQSNLPVGWNVAFGLLVVAYYVLLEGYLGQTVGKWASGVTVVSNATGRPPGVAGAAVRTLLRLVDGLFAYAVAFVVALSNDERQRIGDMAAHTLVVRTQPARDGEGDECDDRTRTDLRRSRQEA